MKYDSKIIFVVTIVIPVLFVMILAVFGWSLGKP